MRYHRALAIEPEDAFAAEMLNLCMQECSSIVPEKREATALRTPSPVKSRVQMFISPQIAATQLLQRTPRRAREPQSKASSSQPTMTLAKVMDLPEELRDDIQSELDSKEAWAPARYLRRAEAFEQGNTQRKEQSEEEEGSAMDLESEIFSPGDGEHLNYVRNNIQAFLGGGETTASKDSDSDMNMD